MSYLKDREIWLSNVPTGNPPAGYVWVFIQNGVFVVRDSNGLDKIMATTTGTVTNATSASYVEYSNVASKPALISGSSQVSYTGLSNIPVGIVSGSSQVTYSGLTGVPSGIVSGSAQIASFGIFATTGSNGFNGSQSITGSLTVTGQVVAQTLNVQQVTSSIVYSSGSNIFGNTLGNTQQFTGSVFVTGSLTVAGAGTFTNSVTAVNAVLGNTSNNTNAIQFLDANSTKTHLGSAFGATFIQNNNFYNGSAYVFDDNTIGSANITLSAGTINFQTGAANVNPSTKLTMLTNGNVGIGTTTPTNGKLEVQQTASTAALWVQTGGTTSAYTIADFRTGTNLPALQLLGNGEATFGGNVGLGSISSYAKFNISTGNDNQMAIGTTSVGQTAGIFLADGPTTSSVGYKWEFGKASNNDYFIYSYGTAGFPFQINYASGSATFSNSVTIQGGNSLFVNNAVNTRSGYLKTSGNGTELSSFAGAGEPLILIAPDTTATIRFYTGGSTGTNERMRISSGGNVGIRTIDPLATLATLGGAVQIMGEYPNHQTIIKSAGASGTFSGQLTITIPQMSNAASDGFGGFSCEVYVSGFEGYFCHVWFSGYLNGGITLGEATILRSSGGWSISQAAFGDNLQGFQFIIDYPTPYIIHPTARIIFNKGGSINAAAYPANNISAVFS